MNTIRRLFVIELLEPKRLLVADTCEHDLADDSVVAEQALVAAEHAEASRGSSSPSIQLESSTTGEEETDEDEEETDDTDDDDTEETADEETADEDDSDEDDSDEESEDEESEDDSEESDDQDTDDDTDDDEESDDQDTDDDKDDQMTPTSALSTSEVDSSDATLALTASGATQPAPLQAELSSNETAAQRSRLAAFDQTTAIEPIVVDLLLATGVLDDQEAEKDDEFAAPLSDVDSSGSREWDVAIESIADGKLYSPI